MSVTLDVDDEPIPGLDADGRPDPAYAAGLGIVPASRGRRAAAFTLDAAIWAVLDVPAVIGSLSLASALSESGWDPAALTPAELTTPLILVAVGQGLVTIFGLVQLILHGRTARTIGKLALGIRSVNVARFDRPGFWRVVLRALVLSAAQLLLPFVGPAVLFASSAWDPERRGRSWLDRIGRCYAIDVRRGLDPFDARALRHARRNLETSAPDSLPPLPSLASDRAPGDALFIPSARSSSGVVSAAPGEAAEWMPPPLGPAAPVPDSTAAAPRPLEPATSPLPGDGTVAAGFTLAFDDGTLLAASGYGLIGRGPVGTPDEPAAQLVPLTDPSMRISKTHAAFGVESGGFWIADRASRNGTVVEFPDGQARTIEPGVRTSVPPGSRITLGGRSFIVTASSGR